MVGPRHGSTDIRLRIPNTIGLQVKKALHAISNQCGIPRGYDKGDSECKSFVS